ncbi:hypothetical protein TRFO_29018 [Tritrichomonas foetus]|uniref:Wntless-like transmembrane domain-containing protein n=1 Tax=Tritrichomonas foetus TaxID=1144522 RepID=A0A1J4JYM8_9EUKA|nr:hypothetical protein TRFO_29018 [Tritrichomonas foetus]|eukprot:OHT03584.1 hypothetical protein TRFO_29018 [Tritrichomonas foetus]
MNGELQNDIQSVPFSDDDHIEPNMTLEVASKWETLITVFTFLAIAVITVFISCFGPSLEIKEDTKNILEMRETSALSRFYMKFTNLKPTNKYQHFSITFRRQSLGGKISAPVEANFTATYFKDNITIRHQSYQNVKTTVTSTRTSLESTPFVFLKETNIDYDVLLLNTSFEIFTRAYQFSTFSWQYGCSLHEMMILGIRMVYAFVEFLFLILMIFRLKKFPKNLWRTEQKYTLYLLVTSILINNPLEVLNLYFPSSIFHILDILFSSVFISFFAIYFIIIFDLVNYKNRVLDSSFYSKKILFFCIYFIFNFISKCITDFFNLSEKLEQIMEISSLLFICVAGAWMISLMKSAFQKTDDTEKFILKLYSGAIAIAIIFEIFGYSLLTFKPELKVKPFNTLLTHAVVNLMVLFMVEIHFPALPEEEKLFDEVDSDEILEIEKMIDEEDALNENNNQLFEDTQVDDEDEKVQTQ